MFDLAVIGLGPAGLEAINIAVKNNLKVVAFEKNELGGTCLNVGCIPTKAILHSSSLYKEIKNSSKVGIDITDNISINWQQVTTRQKEIVNKFTKLLNMATSKNITLVKQEASLKVLGDDVEIIANNEIYKAKNIIIATGSTAFELPNLPFDNEFILNSDDMFKLEKLPSSIAIVGSGAIGLEWAKIMSDFGVEVKLIEKAQNLAPNLDIELQKRIERILKINKIDFYKDDFIVDIKDNNVVLNSGKSFNVDKVLVAVGRKKILPEIISDNEFEVFDNMQSNIKNVCVAGDALGGLMLAHNASYQAHQIMNKILNNKEITKKLVPSVIYITPEIASIGLREQDIENVEEYKISKLMITSIAKSWCDEAADGIIKIITKDNILVGAHVVIKEASSLISIFAVLIDKKINLDEISEMIFPHPSYAEAILEVVKNG